VCPRYSRISQDFISTGLIARCFWMSLGFDMSSGKLSDRPLLELMLIDGLCINK